MNRLLSIGLASETLLVAALILVALGSYVAATNQIQTISCGLIGCAGYADLFEWQFFYLALALMAISVVGFLFILNASRKTRTTPEEAPN